MKKTLLLITIFILSSCEKKNKDSSIDIVKVPTDIVSKEFINPIFLGINPNMKKYEINKIISDRIKDGRLIETGSSIDPRRIFVVNINEDKVEFDFEVANNKILLSYFTSLVYPLKDFNNLKVKSFAKMIENKVDFLNNHFKKKYPNTLDLKTLTKIEKEFGDIIVFRDSIKTIIIDDYYFTGGESYINLNRYYGQENPGGKYDGIYYAPDAIDYKYDKSEDKKNYAKGKELRGGIKISYYENKDFNSILDTLRNLRIEKEKYNKIKKDSLNKIQPNIDEF
jgi:hypothetical protein